MDVTPWITLLSGLSLAGAAGLNAYIPLLVVGGLGHLGWVSLAPSWSALASPWLMLALSVLLAIELLVDKVPGLDHFNDIIQTFVRPIAGAVLVLAQSGVVSELSPGLLSTFGLLVALGVHSAKATARPVVTASTLGLGTPVVSALEDVVSLGTSLLAVLFPLLVGLVFVAFFGGVVALLLWVRKRRRAPRGVS